MGCCCCGGGGGGGSLEEVLKKLDEGAPSKHVFTPYGYDPLAGVDEEVADAQRAPRDDEERRSTLKINHMARRQAGKRY